MFETAVPTHREVGTVELQRESRAGDRLVLAPHGFRERAEIVLVRAVILVRLEDRDRAGRGRVHETLGGSRLGKRRLEIRDIALEPGEITDGNRPAAHGPL